MRYLKEKNDKVIKVEFPDYESESSSLCKMYLEGKFGENADDVSPYIASTFYAADRYATFKKDLEELKDKISTVAASQIEEIVKKSDKIMTEEIEAAVEEVNEWSGKKLCLPGEGEAETAPYCVNDQNTANSAYDYMKPKNYDGGSITSGHMDMIEQLKLPTPANAGILAVQMLAISDAALAEALQKMKEDMAEGVRKKDAALAEMVNAL